MLRYEADPPAGTCLSLPIRKTNMNGQCASGEQKMPKLPLLPQHLRHPPSDICKIQSIMIPYLCSASRFLENPSDDPTL